MKVVIISSFKLEGKERKRGIKTEIFKKKREYSKFYDTFILFAIVFTSVSVSADISYIYLPVFLTVVFILLQLKRLVTKRVGEKKEG